MKKYRELEKIVKGFSNHRRIEIMELLDRQPGLSLMSLARILKINFKTGGEHVRRLHQAGLVWKQSKLHTVCHTLSPLGKVILKFLRTLE